MPYSDKVAQALVEWLPKEKSNQVRAFHCKMQANSQILYQAKKQQRKSNQYPAEPSLCGVFLLPVHLIPGSIVLAVSIQKARNTSYDSAKKKKFRKNCDPGEKVCKKGLTKSRIFCIILVICCISMQNYAQKVNK